MSGSRSSGRSSLIIEDAHWADRSSRDLLAFLIGYQRAVGNLLIVVTFRSDELHRTHPLRPLLAELATDRLGGQDRAAPAHPRAGRGTRRRRPRPAAGARASPTPSTSAPRATRCSPRSCSPARTAATLVPDSLADLLLQAVRRLPEDTQEVLRVASAGSGVTSDALLAQVTGHDAGKLIAAIRPAVAANVLVTSADGYSFRHALIQEAVHADLLPGEHAAVHTRFARAIDADPSLVSPGPGGHREGAPLVLGAQHDGCARRVVAGVRAGIERGRARGAADAPGPRTRAVGAGAGRRGADRRRPRAGARRGGGRRRGRRRAAARPRVRRPRAHRARRDDRAGQVRVAAAAAVLVPQGPRPGPFRGRPAPGA